jgi:hypothetical protein
MKRAAVVAAIAAIAGAVWYLNRSTATTAAAPPPPPPRTTEPAPAAGPAPIAKVTKVDAEQRKRLADRIATAKATRAATTTRTGAAATHAPAPPSLPSDGAIDPALEPLRVELKTAMREVIPILAECYEASLEDIAEPETRIVAELTLTGDPDVGTLIDAAPLGAPNLPPAFDDCLRSTFQTLALPPLAEGDEVLVRYPFTFAKN